MLSPIVIAYALTFISCEYSFYRNFRREDENVLVRG